MPRRNDIRRILIVGSGPIIIGQACEFDYSGAQACKALRSDGYEVVLINSNPATIMTDPDLADRTYVEPLSVEFAAEVIRRERPDALLSTVGGQTGLNLAIALAEAGVLDKYGVELIGAKVDSIKKAEDRLLFKDAMRKIGLETPTSQLVNSVEKGLKFAATVGYPVILRPSFTMGGTGGGIAYNREECEEILERGLDLSPVKETLIEQSVLGWKEYELEVMRDVAGNAIIVCSIENFDPMGVHTGDSITIAPAQTLTDRVRTGSVIDGCGSLSAPASSIMGQTCPAVLKDSNVTVGGTRLRGIRDGSIDTTPAFVANQSFPSSSVTAVGTGRNCAGAPSMPSR